MKIALLSFQVFISFIEEKERAITDSSQTVSASSSIYEELCGYE